ncbi:hypothetical protein BABINDRAFT_160249, partial [Babjeviella inositovora NRRL Y-12698]
MVVNKLAYISLKHIFEETPQRLTESVGVLLKWDLQLCLFRMYAYSHHTPTRFGRKRDLRVPKTR